MPIRKRLEKRDHSGRLHLNSRHLLHGPSSMVNGPIQVDAVQPQPQDKLHKRLAPEESQTEKPRKTQL